MRKFVKGRLGKRGDSAVVVVVEMVVAVVSSVKGEHPELWRSRDLGDEEEMAFYVLPLPALLWAHPERQKKCVCVCGLSFFFSRVDDDDNLSPLALYLNRVTQVPAILWSDSKKADTTLRERRNKIKILLLSLQMEDFYEILGVGNRATEEEVKRAYHRLCKEHHPDKSKADNAHDQFQAISKAYQTLSDPYKRKIYDAKKFGKRLRPCPEMARVEQIPKGVSPIKITVAVSLKDAYVGNKEVELTFPRMIECERCSGLGSTKLKVCTTCQGHKWVFPCGDDDGGGGDSDPIEFKPAMTCPSCGGKGALPCATGSSSAKKKKVEKEEATDSKEVLKCTDCGGQGYNLDSASLSFLIPIGIRSGQIHMLPEKGDIRLGRRVGDVFVMVNIDPQHGNYRLCKDGTTLVCTKTIRLSDALEGLAGSLTTLDDREIAIPRLAKERGPIRHGEEVWIQGEGMHGAPSSGLRVVYHVELPVFSPYRIEEIRRWEKEIEDQWELLYGRPG